MSYEKVHSNLPSECNFFIAREFLIMSLTFPRINLSQCENNITRRCGAYGKSQKIRL